jgi:hypothetical protein
MAFLTGLATDEVPDGNGMGFVKKQAGGQDYYRGTFLGIASKDFLDLKGHKGKVSMEWL